VDSRLIADEFFRRLNASLFGLPLASAGSQPHSEPLHERGAPMAVECREHQKGTTVLPFFFTWGKRAPAVGDIHNTIFHHSEQNNLVLPAYRTLYFLRPVSARYRFVFSLEKMILPASNDTISSLAHTLISP